LAYLRKGLDEMEYVEEETDPKIRKFVIGITAVASVHAYKFFGRMEHV
jgi:hypothetical protein